MELFPVFALLLREKGSTACRTTGEVPLLLGGRYPNSGVPKPHPESSTDW